MSRTCSAHLSPATLSWRFFFPGFQPDSLLTPPRATPHWPLVFQGLKRLEHSTTEMIDITQSLQKASRGTNTAVQKVKLANVSIFFSHSRPFLLCKVFVCGEHHTLLRRSPAHTPTHTHPGAPYTWYVKTNAQMLHASGGMDVAAYQRRLDELRIQSLTAPQPRFGETSVDHYLQVCTCDLLRASHRACSSVSCRRPVCVLQVAHSRRVLQQ